MRYIIFFLNKNHLISMNISSTWSVKIKEVAVTASFFNLIPKIMLLINFRSDNH